MATRLAYTRRCTGACSLVLTCHKDANTSSSDAWSFSLPTKFKKCHSVSVSRLLSYKIVCFIMHTYTQIHKE